jgi:hypothetical protein
LVPVFVADRIVTASIAASRIRIDMPSHVGIIQ